MTPAIHHLTDDRDKALAVCEDLHKVLAKFRVGVFAREADRLRIALSDPVGKGRVKWHGNRAAPEERQFVTEWRDFFNVQILESYDHQYLNIFQGNYGDRLRAVDVIAATGQVLRHFDSAVIPAPIDNLPTMLLCDHEGQADGRWRAYSLIAELDCYGYTERGIKPRRTQ